MHTVAASLLIVGAIVALASLVVLEVLPTGLLAWRDPVSQYGITRFRAGYWLAAFGAAIGGVGGALFFGTLSGGVIAAILLWVFVAARVLIPLAPMDAPGAPRTSRGRVHNLLAIIAFAAVTAAAFVAAGTLHDTGHASLASISTVCAIVMALGSLGVILSLFTSVRRIFGVAERVIYVGFIAWFLVLGIGVLAGS